MNDAAAAELVTDFYRKLRKDSVSKAVALQRAQRKLIADPEPFGDRACGADRAGASLEHMKRTNLVLREELLEEALRLSGEKTYSRAVERALEEFVRRVKARQILRLRGSGEWSGDLAEMRNDRPRRRKRA